MPDIVLDDISSQLDRLRTEVDRALRHYTRFDDGCPELLQSAIRYSLLAPGKRLRPCLVLLAAEACGQRSTTALPAACAVEMIHAYSLIHDDLPAMDDDDMRRGQPTCHKQFDEATAILAGDALLALAFQILAKDIRPPAVAVRCLHELALSAGATQLVGGQVADLTAEFCDLDAQELVAIHRRKTGAMFRVALGLGAMIAEAPVEHIRALNTYGEKLGLAFQIIDGVLDVEGDSAELGKTTGKDAAISKPTYSARYGIDESRRMADECLARATKALANASVDDRHILAIGRWIIGRSR